MDNDETMGSTFMEEVEQLIRENELSPFFPVRNADAVPSNINDSTPSTIETPDPLNTAFMNETIVSEQHSQISLSQQQQQQSQTTKEASSAIHGLISTIIEQEDEIINLRSPTTTPMKSIDTMPKTPSMKSTGTMPRTPTMISTGTMPKTPTMKSTGTMPKTPTTIDLISPTMASTSTIPKIPTTIDLVLPTVASTSTMPKTPTTIDLISPTMVSTGTMPKTPTTIDLISPTIEIIDLRSSQTPPDTSNIGSPVNLKPK